MDFLLILVIASVFSYYLATRLRGVGWPAFLGTILAIILYFGILRLVEGSFDKLVLIAVETAFFISFPIELLVVYSYRRFRKNDHASGGGNAEKAPLSDNSEKYGGTQ